MFDSENQNDLIKPISVYYAVNTLVTGVVQSCA